MPGSTWRCWDQSPRSPAPYLNRRAARAELTTLPRFESSAPDSGRQDPPLALEPLFQLPAHDVAKREHALVGQRVINEKPLLTPRDKAYRVEYLQMLGDVGLAQARLLHELVHRLLALAHGREQL